MPAYKNQHYVPQFYFRLFSKDNTTIEQFYLDKELHHSINISKACKKSYFYSRDPAIEKALSPIESKYNKTITSILDHQDLTNISDNDYFLLLSFLTLQSMRTKRNKMKIDQQTDSAVKQILSTGEKFDLSEDELDGIKITHHGMFLETLVLSFPATMLIEDLSKILLVNKTTYNFIFSDDPVILYNRVIQDKHPYLGGKGLAQPGLMIICPLNLIV